MAPRDKELGTGHMRNMAETLTFAQHREACPHPTPLMSTVHCTQWSQFTATADDGRCSRVRGVGKRVKIGISTPQMFSKAWWKAHLGPHW